MSKYAAFGASLVFDPGGSAEQTIGQVSNISGPGVSTDAVDATTHDSASGHREFLAGLVDGGEVQVEIVFDPETASTTPAGPLGLLEAKAQDRTTNTWQVVHNTATDHYRRFSAIVTNFSGAQAPVDGVVTATATLKITGAITSGAA